MISKETIYKACAIWAIVIIASLVAMPFVGMSVSAFYFWLYAEIVLTWTGAGIVIFASASQRPDIVTDLIDDEPQ